MNRVVLDTNVLVSGLLTRRGNCAMILGLVGDEILHPCLDERILCEYEAVLLRPHLRIDRDDVTAVLALLRSNGEMVVALPLPVTLPDPDDRPWLEVAATAKAPLISGNLRHFPSRCRSGVTVVTPREFLERLRVAGWPRTPI